MNVYLPTFNDFFYLKFEIDNILLSYLLLLTSNNKVYNILFSVFIYVNILILMESFKTSRL